eukprot:CAMPEP_0196806970 /NCGR_PEP_ID=MMETSP1362-20130617/6906_1 /TAXON_ID=163516 /ORGANISM="Leptocylindrus danicus, Strain CCMP1856" /LENGTH=339 /DNA_ID=CAMNT_0042180681 /DNA_START=235 /DNA_END=1254 /DNA_ORIENTATION=-
MEAGNSMIGRRVAKIFLVDEDDPTSEELYHGTVHSVNRGKRNEDDEEEVDLYEVQYDDGDKEDMELSELNQYLVRPGDEAADEASTSSSTTLGSALRGGNHKENDQQASAVVLKYNDSDKEGENDAKEFEDSDDFGEETGEPSASSSSDEDSDGEEVATAARGNRTSKKRKAETHRRHQSSNKKNSTWDKRFEELEEYLVKYGDTNVPQNYTGNPALANWVQRQKQVFKDFLCNGASGGITEGRIEKLNSIGFNWGNVWPGAWNRSYEKLLQHISDNDNSVDVDKMDTALRSWFILQRELLRQHLEIGVVHIDFMEDNYSKLLEVPGIAEELSVEESGM